MVRLLIALLLTWPCFAQLNPHPRLLLSDNRHGSTMLEQMRVKAAQNHADWIALRNTADAAMNSVAPSGTSEQYALIFALMYQILNGAPSTYGAAYTAQQYGAYGITVFSNAMEYWRSQECINPYITITSPCELDQSSPAHWTSDTGNLWYSYRTFRRTSGHASNYSAILTHNGAANAGKSALNQLSTQWDWLMTAPTSTVPAFTGGGANDLTLGSNTNWGDIELRHFCVEVQSADTVPNTFRWSLDNCVTWQAQNVPMSTSTTVYWRNLGWRWATTTGHMAGDRWTWVSTPARVYVYSDVNPATKGESISLRASWLYSNQLRYRGWTFALIYDWLYGLLSQQQRTDYAAAFRNVTLYFLYGSSSGQTAASLVYPPKSFASNLRSGYWMATLYLGLAMQGHSESDTGSTNEEIVRWEAEWNTHVKGFLRSGFGSGGIPQEGAEYGTSQGAVMALTLLAYQTATNVDLFADAPNIVADHAQALLAHTSSAPHWKSGVYYAFQWGEMQKVYYPPGGFKIAAAMLSYLLGNTTLGHQIRWWFANRGSSYDYTVAVHLWERMAFVDNPVGTMSDYRATLPKGYFAPGTPSIVFNGDRTSDDATWGWLMATELNQEHTRSDMIGGFAVSRGGVPLLESPQGYHSGVAVHKWFSSSEAQPLLLLKRDGAPPAGDLTWKGPEKYSNYIVSGQTIYAGINRHKIGANFVYAHANTGPAYYTSTSASLTNSLGSYTNILSAGRELVFLPPHSLVFLDRANVAAAARSRLQFPTPGDIQQDSAGFTVSANGKAAAVRILTAPSTVTYTAGEVETILSPEVYAKFTKVTMAPPGTYPTVHATPYPDYTANNIGIATSNSSSTTHRWLWTVETGAQGFVPRTMTEINVGPNHFGVMLGTNGPDIVVFARNDTATTTAMGWNLSFTGTARCIVANLAPGTYQVYSNDVLILEGIDVGTDGVLSLTAPAGLLSIVQSGGPPLSITTQAALPGANVSVPYSVQLTVEGGMPPYTWELVAGTLPAGLSLAANGEISGTPSGIGEFTFTVRVSGSGPQFDSRVFSLQVGSSNLSIVNIEPYIQVNSGSTVQVELTAANGVAPYQFSMPSSSCAWLSLTQSGTLSGLAVGPQICEIEVAVTDAAAAYRSYTITVEVIVQDSGPLTITATPAVDGVLVRYGYRGLPSDTNCVISVSGQNGALIESVMDAGGLARRQTFVRTALASQEDYTARASCGSYSASQTLPDIQGFAGTASMNVSLFRPSWQQIDRAQVRFGVDQTTAESTSVLNCIPNCTFQLNDQPRGQLLFLRHLWLDSLQGAQAQSRPRATIVP